jgi:hypothetical protein
VVWALSALAGFLGALTGLGGGVVVVPALTLALGVDMKYAIGASLVSVIATSSGAAAAYVREGFSNIRIGMFLEIATTIGAVLGAFLASRFSTHALAIVFGLILLQAAYLSFKGTPENAERVASDALATRLRLGGSYPVAGSPQTYGVRNVPAGSGAVKVIAMDRVMRIPFKVSTTTSNFMIGVTAAASAGLYLKHGYINPQVAMPVMLGVLAGALVGAKLLVHMRVKTLRMVFGAVILALAIEMIVNGITGKV